MSKLRAILKDLCQQAYWYGEETGDYNMLNFDKTDFFKEATIKIDFMENMRENDKINTLREIISQPKKEMIEKSELILAKINLYRVLIKKIPEDLTNAEVDLGYILSSDPDIQKIFDENIRMNVDKSLLCCRHEITYKGKRK